MVRRGLWAALLGLGALAAWEAAAVARAVRRDDPAGHRDHAATVGSGRGTPLRLVLLGDSAVDGHGLQAGESLPRRLAAGVAVRTGRRVRVRSLAVSGATSADVAALQVARLRATGGVDAVVVGVGVNDALQLVPVDVVAELTRAVVRGVRGVAPDAALVYVPCHDLTRAPGLGPVLRRVVGWRCRRVAGRQRAVLSDLRVPVAVADRHDTADVFGDDGLHPSARGVEVIAALVVAALLDRPGRPSC